MHTALCAFDDRASAERARDRLLQSGFARQDIHLQHGTTPAADPATRSEMLRSRGGVEHEIALDPQVVSRVAGFFGHLFGLDHPNRPAWDTHSDSGRTVLVVDAHDEAEAERARAVMHTEQGADSSVVHRPVQRPVREIVADATMQPGTGTTASLTSPATTAGRDPAWTDRPTTRTEDRAIASGEQRSLDLGDSGLDKASVRDTDKGTDRPLSGRDGLGRTRKDD